MLRMMGDCVLRKTMTNDASRLSSLICRAMRSEQSFVVELK